MQQEEATNKKRKKIIFLASLALNLTILFVFKYNNFFFETIDLVFANDWTARFIHSWLLPVGISFYTFQSIAYSYDVYKGDVSAEKNPINFALYIAFFPQLVAGPIERAKNLLPQIKAKYNFKYEEISYGLKLILLGLIKKVVFANNLAVYVDMAYKNPSANPGLPLILGMVFFAFQIYFDFSGYTDIARGSARLFGIKIMENFKGPYLSSSIREFWRRWHISLSTWFRDYLYIPLGGNQKGSTRTYFNLLIVFFITGLWHGANYTFLIWAAIHGGMIAFERLKNNTISLKTPRFISVILTFIITTISWVFFRSETLDHATTLLSNACNVNLGQFSSLNLYNTPIGILDLLTVLGFVLLGIILHFVEYKSNLIDYLNKFSRPKRIIVVALAVQFFILFGKFYDNAQFIYFQF